MVQNSDVQEGVFDGGTSVCLFPASFQKLLCAVGGCSHHTVANARNLVPAHCPCCHHGGIQKVWDGFLLEALVLDRKLEGWCEIGNELEGPWGLVPLLPSAPTHHHLSPPQAGNVSCMSPECPPGPCQTPLKSDCCTCIPGK